MNKVREVSSSEEGYTITELMVVVLILSLLLGAFYAFMFGGERATTDGREWLEMNQTARLAFERLSRELREADQILEVNLTPDSEKVKFQADFNVNGTFNNGAYSPTIGLDERLTYEYDAANRRILLSSDADPLTKSILAENITDLTFKYYGSDPRLDCGVGDPPTYGAGCSTTTGDGIVTWQEIDHSKFFGLVGYGNDNSNLDAEFPSVTSVVIEMTVTVGGRSHNYRTAVELRNLFK